MDFGYFLILGGILLIMYTMNRSEKDKNAQIFDAFETTRGLGGSTSNTDKLRKSDP